jgi:hypothetical protein|tara:strand:- start:8117 stop:8341 length:225 start_codon:yes stop_codon:yes gene_type:complete
MTMATVADSSGNGGGRVGSGPENPLTQINQTLSATPVGATTPNFVGELVEDTANENTYRAYGSTNASWEKIERP